MSDLPNEEWRDIEGYKNHYQVSNLGRVRTLKSHEVRHLHPRSTGRYSQVALSLNGQSKYFTVHYLVAWAFLGKPADGEVINHVSGDSFDNRLENLEYVTQKQNIAHSMYTLGNVRGNQKLTIEDVKEIVALIDSGKHNAAEIARMYGVSKTQISRIRSGQSWQPVTSVIPAQKRGRGRPPKSAHRKPRGAAATPESEDTTS